MKLERQPDYVYEAQPGRVIKSWTSDEMTYWVHYFECEEVDAGFCRVTPNYKAFRETIK